MNHRHVYMLIIEHAKSEMKNGHRPSTKYQKKNFSNQYFEFHHILPKSLFPNWNKRKSNIVALTAREHFFCHQLLDKIYPDTNMFMALWLLANDGQNNYCVKGSRLYESLRIKAATFSKNRTWCPTDEQIANMKIGCKHRDTPEYRKKLSDSLKGKKFSDERKKHISESLKGRKQTDEEKAKRALTRYHADFSPKKVEKFEDFVNIKDGHHIFYDCKMCGKEYHIKNFTRVRDKVYKSMICYSCFRKRGTVYENKCKS